MVLMVGSTGRLGSAICRALAMKGIPIRAMIRETADRQKVERLKKYGSLLIVGDLRDPGSLVKACQGLHNIICSASAFSNFIPGVNDFERVDLNGVKNLIEIAARSGVEHFVYVSLCLKDQFRSPHLDARQAVEKFLMNSGMRYSILHPCFLAETWFSPEMGFDLAARKSVIFGNGENPLAWISIRDVAGAAVNALTNPFPENVMIDLRGPDLVSQLDMIRFLERKLDCFLEKEFLPEEYLSFQRISATCPFEKSLYSLFLACAIGEESFYAFPNRTQEHGTLSIESLLPSITNPTFHGNSLFPINSRAIF